MRRALIVAAASVAAVVAPASAGAVQADAPRCVGNGTLDAKYCVDADGSCLLVSYSSGAGSRCLIRNP